MMWDAWGIWNFSWIAATLHRIGALLHDLSGGSILKYHEDHASFIGRWATKRGNPATTTTTTTTTSY